VPRVVGWTRERGEGVEALRRGAIHDLATSPAQAARAAELVVLAVPPAATLEFLSSLRQALRPGARLTDVASVKRVVLERAAAEGLGGRFCGGHPLAGTHRTGFLAARSDLFAGAIVYVCPTGTDEGEATAHAVAGFWREVAGAHPVRIDASEHDAQLAWTSHLPQAVASALAVTLAERDLGALSFGTGGRDTTRLAASDAGLWTDILLQNAGPVADAVTGAGERLARLADLLRRGDRAGLRAFLERGATFRKGIER
jgi:prephenate dehydrogenase